MADILKRDPHKVMSNFVKMICVGIISLWSCSANAESSAVNNADIKKNDVLQKGEYLFHISGCETCHTKPDGKFLAGGRPFFMEKKGIVYSSNITPDQKTGIGNYTNDEFVTALQKGIGHKGKHLYPVMPYYAYTLMNRDDILAIKVYLDYQKPVHNVVPKRDMAFPYNIRGNVAFWNWINNSNRRFENDNTQNKEWNRGKFLVQGPGHCAYCHSPLNWSNAHSEKQAYSGYKFENWEAYNISSDTDTGIGAWSDQALEQYLKTGYAEGHGAATGPMAEMVGHSLRYLTDNDIRSMVVYLRSIPPQEKGEEASMVNAEELKNVEPSRSHGSRLFAGNCGSCHLTNGLGRQSDYASLWGSRTATMTTGKNLVRTILDGSSIENDPLGKIAMPAFRDSLSDQDIADIANFVIAHFGNRNGHVTAEQVKDQRTEPHGYELFMKSQSN